MKELLNTTRTKVKRQNKKLFYIEAEKIVREASDNFIYFRDYKTALRQVNKVLVIDNTHVKALILKGNILFCLDREDEALEFFEKALGLDPFSAEAYGSKSNTLDVLGKVKEALTCCEKALKNITPKDYELLPALYDHKIALLIKMKRYEEAKAALKESYRYLKTEDSFKMAINYRDVINPLLQEQKYRKKIATERFTVIQTV